ncbi:biotin--[acetyl-CoA-carboxylase] ligase [Leucobacter denitrificans]|uniref:biotin--[biotin carboxyl-carrier protein] ligase n=1 Tax=Leucobacter denitrificans TaxID=683042 RepID=A0A7G9S7F8_9MICO|nr:biotin--[acetyl-CoA-carboxylase] ligase [Leucobacter denitrificans]QNN63783.1 biotin--[acetyl-CoA-carboxylase] ligase [Leucobacter denitrificans]
MHLDRTHALLPRVEWREESPSTNAELREMAQAAVRSGSPLPHGILLVTDQQTAGKGRLERGWVTPKGQALAVSVLVRGFGAEIGDATGKPDWGELGPAWLPLIAGSAVTAGLQPLYRATDDHEALRVGTKWPNDVHVRDEDDAIEGRPGKKLCGILCELLPDGSAVFGMGLNLLIPEWELPTDRATSLLASGADVGGAESFADEAGADLADRVIEGIVSDLLRLTKLAAESPQAIRNRVARNSLTLGTEVRAHLPGGKLVDGRARALAADGALIIDLPTGGSLEVNAADIEHLR